ncbi:hypothetical protein GPJ56_008755 [Histomonas meleagridis]|uniref:uncharacterized protein n=1 Tax=Histomonas meleagridis TaxID=135588 RepID=UPI003559D0ED|nr:hypothetical protein GPJ56_008755 [Histomonas meleagridis]KAH0805452.1 hypothetical protein GO595_001834 [Histomonas meleagridis]
MDTGPILGWYLYVNSDSKKSKPTPRWVVVNNFWLEISQKSTEEPFLIIHLGFTETMPLPIEENPGLNTLIVKTNSYSGNFEYKFTTNNRFDIIEFNDSLQQGKESWNNLVRNGSPLTSYEASFKNKKVGLFTKSVECSVSPGGIKISTGKSSAETTQYTYDQISYVRPIENKQAQCFEIALEGGQKSEIQLQSHGCLEIEKILAVILYHLAKRGS